MGFLGKTIEKQVKIEKVASICMAQLDYLQKPLENGSKLKRLLQFNGLVGFLQEPFIQKRAKLKSLLRFTCHALVGFLTKTIQKRVKFEKFSSICEAHLDFLQKPFKKGSKLKRLLRFGRSGRVSCKSHSKPGQN